jgi:hypothetical protein
MLGQRRRVAFHPQHSPVSAPSRQVNETTIGQRRGEAKKLTVIHSDVFGGDRYLGDLDHQMRVFQRPRAPLATRAPRIPVEVETPRLPTYTGRQPNPNLATKTKARLSLHSWDGACSDRQCAVALSGHLYAMNRGRSGNGRLGLSGVYGRKVHMSLVCHRQNSQSRGTPM